MTTPAAQQADVALTLDGALNLLDETGDWVAGYAFDAVAGAELAHRAVRAALADPMETPRWSSPFVPEHRAKGARARHLVTSALTRGRLQGLCVLIVDPHRPTPPTPPAGAVAAVPIRAVVIALPTPTAAPNVAAVA